MVWQRVTSCVLVGSCLAAAIPGRCSQRPPPRLGGVFSAGGGLSLCNAAKTVNQRGKMREQGQLAEAWGSREGVARGPRRGRAGR